jgi:hypothetical protein
MFTGLSLVNVLGVPLDMFAGSALRLALTAWAFFGSTCLS